MGQAWTGFRVVWMEPVELAGDPLEPSLWSMGDSSLKVVIGLGMKVPF